VAVLAGLNLFGLAVVYGSSSLYRPIERLMKTLVLLVMCCFLVNFFLARPDPLAMLRGLVPTPPPGGFAALISPRADPSASPRPRRSWAFPPWRWRSCSWPPVPS